ncbi:MAG: hypothetical protein Q9191_000316 [Dirinaria sp. TL-2023a]
MDPLSAVGLVANVVQLVDAAVKAVTICHQIYTQGAAIEDSRLLYTSEHLQKSYSALSDSLMSSPVTGPKVLRGGIDLEELCSQCRDTANELQAELQSLRRSAAGGVGETTSKFFLKKRKKRTIEKLKNRLDEYQKILDSKVLINIRHELGTLESQSEEHYLKHQEQLSQLSANLASCHISVSNELTAELAKAIKANEEQHIHTRQHAEKQIERAMKDLKISQDQYRSEDRKERVSRQQYE